MAAKDRFHSAVKIALEKEQWVVADDPLLLEVGGTKFEIDLGAEQLLAAERGKEKIAVEIKTFLSDSPLTDYHAALGQFLNYRLALEISDPTRVLYLLHGSKNIDPAIAEEIEAELDAFIEHHNNEASRKGSNKKPITSTARKNLDLVVDILDRQAQQSQIKIPGSVTVSIPKIVEWLNDPTQSSLVIVQSHNPDDLRDFAATLSNVIYESRRRSGNITPLVSFIFDEADEFIPSNASSNDSKKRSKAAVMTLARRGRKFGLGIGISTQRIANLDVNTLAQPHTYFVSKLPREYDRREIAEAFGISEDMFRQTFRFKKGDWLLASYDATGLEALPIPIHAEDANKAILDFVDQQVDSGTLAHSATR